MLRNPLLVESPSLCMHTDKTQENSRSQNDLTRFGYMARGLAERYNSSSGFLNSDCQIHHWLIRFESPMWLGSRYRFLRELPQAVFGEKIWLISATKDLSLISSFWSWLHCLLTFNRNTHTGSTQSWDEWFLHLLPPLVCVWKPPQKSTKPLCERFNMCLIQIKSIKARNFKCFF